jgi:autotransporter-associated beta strand protein
MKRRPSLSLLGNYSALLALALAVAHAATTPTYEWTGAAGDGAWENPANWTNHLAPGIQQPPGDIVFGSSNQPYLSLASNASLLSLTFTGDYPHYYLFSTSTTAPVILGLGAGGITLANSGARSVDISGPQLNLLASQTWNTGGNLSIYGSITAASTAFTLTKTGSGYLALGGNSTFAGGLAVTAGTLYLGSSSTDTTGKITANPAALFSGPVGTGPLTLANNTAIASLFGYDVTLANALSLGSNVLFDHALVDFSAGSSGNFGKTNLSFGGAVTATSATTILRIDPSARVTFAGPLSGPAGSTLIVTNGGSAVFSGTTDPSIAAIVANAGAVFFGQGASLPSATIQALNGGYVGMGAAFDGTPDSGHLSPAAIIARITSPAGFSGVLGFDSDPNSGGGNLFHGTLDLSGFTNAAFQGLGSASFASLANDLVITPPTGGNYKFGGGGGRLTVSSSLNAPTGLVVSSPATSPLTLVLQGNNAFTGNVKVRQSYLILDSASALPATARVELAASGYLGSTEWWLGQNRTAADLLSLLDPALIDPTGIIGFDTSGPASFSRVIGTDLDFNLLFPPPAAALPGGPAAAANPLLLPYLGTTTFGTTYPIGGGSVTGLVIEGDIYVPFGLTLKLAGLNGGKLTVASALTPEHGITALLIGHPDPIMGANGTVRLTGANTYTGGTTLLAGNLALGASTAVLPRENGGTSTPSSPLGTGDLVIDASAPRPALFPDGDVTLPNNLIVNSAQLTLGEAETNGSFTFDGTISGHGRLIVAGAVTLNQPNTYAGGTEITWGPLNVGANATLGSGDVFVGSAGVLNFAASAAIGSLNIENSSQSNGSAGGIINLAPSSVLTITQSADGKFEGQIAGNGASLVKTGPAQLSLNGYNTYSGGTTIASGLVVTQSTHAFGSGPITIDAGAALGLDYSAVVTNEIVFNGASGNRAYVAGFGTLAPASGTLVIGAHAALSPGAKIDPSRNNGGGSNGANNGDNGDHTPPVGILTIGDATAPANLVFGSGGAYDWGIQTSPYGQGFMWDVILVNGSLTFSSDATAPFKFKLSTFDAQGDAGLLSGFNNQQSYTWTVLTASDGILGFEPSKISLSDTAGFLNNLGGGSFSLTMVNSVAGSGSALLLNFSPAAVPEPSTYALLALGLALFALTLRRRK